MLCFVFVVITIVVDVDIGTHDIMEQCFFSSQLSSIFDFKTTLTICTK